MLRERRVFVLYDLKRLIRGNFYKGRFREDLRGPTPVDLVKTHFIFVKVGRRLS